MIPVETKLYSPNSVTHRYGQFGVFRIKMKQEQKGIVSARDTISFGKSLLLRQMGKVSGNTCLVSGYPLINSLPFALSFGITNHKLSWTFREYFYTILFSQSYGI